VEVVLSDDERETLAEGGAYLKTALITPVLSRVRIRRRTVTTWGSAGRAKDSRLSMTPSAVAHRLFQINERGEW
jgi:hypothetical protein